MRNLIKNSVCAFSKYSGLLRMQERVQAWSDGYFAAILLFHRVTDAIPEDDLTVHPRRFDHICRLLSRGFRVVTVSDIFQLVRAREPIPPRTVAITFDDGYQDNLFAARKLAEYGLPACFFLTAAYMETERTYKWDAEDRRLPNLTWEQVREMKGMGFEIGSHSLSHPRFAAISRNRALRELIESKRVIEAQIGEPVRYFAYPFGGIGDFREDLLPLVQEAGYEGCLSGYGGFVYRGAEPRMLPRQAVPACNMLCLEARLRGGLAWFEFLKRRVPALEDRTLTGKLAASRGQVADPKV